MKKSIKVILMTIFVLFFGFFFKGNETHAITINDFSVPPPDSLVKIDGAFVNNDTGGSNSYISTVYPQAAALTPKESWQFGSIWSSYKLDLTKEFNYDSYVYLGEKTGSNFADDIAADGITFTLQNDSRGQKAYGTNGGGMGVYSSGNSVEQNQDFNYIENALSVELDTWYNNSDRRNDQFDYDIPVEAKNSGHIGIVRPTKGSAGNSKLGHLQVMYDKNKPLANNAWQRFSIKWEPITLSSGVLNGKLTYSYGGQRNSYVVEDVKSVFKGTSVYFGFTSSTGNNKVFQGVSINKLPQNPQLEVTKSVTPSTARIGDVVDYKITGTNVGEATLYKTLFEDKLPNGMSEPTNVRIVGAFGDTYSISKGSSNANQYGEYYTWDDSSKKLTVYVSRVNDTDGITPNSSRSVLYSSKVLDGIDGDKKVNKVTFSGSNSTNNPTDNATLTIKGDPKLDLSKSASVSKAKVGDTVHYSLSLGKNTGNATLLFPVIKDILPEGMDKPTNVGITTNGGGAMSIKEGKSNANSSGEYYAWDETSRILTVHINSVSINEIKGIEYDSKVLSGNDGDKKINRATVTASNTIDKPTAEATIIIEDKKIKLHIKQEVINKNSQVVVPSSGGGNLKQVNINTVSDVQGSYGVTFPSYEADTNKAFETVSLKWLDDYRGYIPECIIPELYEYAGYMLTKSEGNHDSSKRTLSELPLINYSLNDEYWLTIYIEPNVSSDGPPFYNWDYKVNDFGKIKFN